MNSEDSELEQSFLRIRPALLRYLAGRTGSLADGEDLAQEAWLRVARHAPAVLAAPFPYIMRVARNLAIDFGRSRARLNHAEADALLDVPSPTPGPEQVSTARSDLRAFARLLAELSPRRRDILIAARLRREPYVDIARRHGVSVRTVEYEVRMALDHCIAGMARLAGESGGGTEEAVPDR